MNMIMIPFVPFLSVKPAYVIYCTISPSWPHRPDDQMTYITCNDISFAKPPLHIVPNLVGVGRYCLHRQSIASDWCMRMYDNGGARNERPGGNKKTGEFPPPVPPRPTSAIPVARL